MKKMHHQRRQSQSVVTVLGVVQVVRRWWHAIGQGSVVPADEVIDPGLASVSLGVREMVCRLNNNSTSFDTTAGTSDRTAQIVMSGQQVRSVVQTKGRAVLAAQQASTLPTAFQAKECVVNALLPKAEPTSRIDHGTDGVMVPIIKDAETIKRWAKVCKWTCDLCHTLKHNRYEPAWESLTKWPSTLRSPAKK